MTATSIYLFGALSACVASGILRYFLHRTRADLFGGPFPIDHKRFGIMSKRATRLAVKAKVASGLAFCFLMMALGAYLFSNWKS